KNIHLGGLTHIVDNLPGLGTQLNGSALVEPTPRPTVGLKSSNKYMKQYLAEMKAEGALKTGNLTDNGVDAWIGAHFFIQLAKSLAKGKVNSAGLIAKAQKAKFSMPGFVGASDFTAPAPCPKSAPQMHNYVMYTGKVVNGKIVS